MILNVKYFKIEFYLNSLNYSEYFYTISINTDYDEDILDQINKINTDYSSNNKYIIISEYAFLDERKFDNTIKYKMCEDILKFIDRTIKDKEYEIKIFQKSKKADCFKHIMRKEKLKNINI